MIPKIKLKTHFEFDAAHRLVGYDGKCNNIHGHIWKVEIEIEGDKNQLDCNGILWDFTNAKKIKELLDHKTILKKCGENVEIHNAIVQTCGTDSVYLMSENPTAENLCYEILAHCKTSNPDLIYKIAVWESPKSSSEVKELKEENEVLTFENVTPGNCPHCGLNMDEHDGSGFCPPGTEEFGGRR